MGSPSGTRQSRCRSVDRCYVRRADSRVQVYIRQDSLPELDFRIYRLLDFGDWVGAEGRLFRTKTNELTIWASRLHFLAKCLVPLPEKWHGLTDIEIRYRQRYLDLIDSDAVDYVQMDVCCQGGYSLGRRLMAAIAAVGRLRRSGEPVQDPAWLDALERSRRCLGIGRVVRLAWSSRVVRRRASGPQL